MAGYYGRALAAHGPTPRGVDWSSRASQELRFATLLRGIDWSAAPSVLDYGCGWGALAEHLEGTPCTYVGYDIAPAMIAAARPRSGARFTCDPADLAPADHVIASGIFNVKLDTPQAAWSRYVEETLARLWSLTRRRLAFNMLPPASAPALARPHLHYASPAAIVAHCARTLGGQVSLRDRYGLWEFTVILERWPA